MRLDRHPDDPAPLTAACVTLVILFALAIRRAREFVGARLPGVVSQILRAGWPTAHRDDERQPDRSRPGT